MRFKELMKRSMVALMIIVLLMMTVGCQPKLTAKQTMQKISETSLTLKDVDATFEGQMDMIINGDIPEEAAPYMEMLKNIKFNGNMQIKDTDTLADLAMHYSVNLNGMTMDIEVYFDGEKMIVKYPMLPQYITVDMEQLVGMINEQSDSGLVLNYSEIVADIETLSNTWVPGFDQKILATVDEASLELIDSYEFKFGDEIIKSKALKVTVTPDSMMNIFYAAFDQVKDSKELYDILKKYDTNDDLGTFELYQAALAEGRAEMFNEADIEKMKETFNNMQYVYTIGYNNNFEATMVAMDMKANIIDDSVDMDATMNMSAVYKFVYKDVAVTFPEITTENSLSIFDMLGGMMY